MNLAEHQDLWNRIQKFEFDEPNATITFSKKLAAQQKWSPTFTDRVVEEYRKFIFLCCISPNGASPSKLVDEVWHLHLTYTKSYWNAFCRNTLGKDIHHYPSTGGDKEDHKHADWYEETLRLYESSFGIQPPSDIWPRPVNASRPAERSQPVDASLPGNGRPYRTGKKMMIIVTVLLLLPFGINYSLTGIVSPFSLKGPQFLLFYAIFSLAAFIAHYLLRKDRLMHLRKMSNNWSIGEMNIFQLTHFVHGKERALETCLVDLYRRELISVNDSGKIVVHRSKYRAPEKEENPLIPALLNKADGSSVNYKAMAEKWAGKKSFQHPAIEELYLLIEQKESFFQKGPVIIIALLPGLARVMQGLINDKPVGILFLEIIALLVVAWIINYKLSSIGLVYDTLREKLLEKAGKNQMHADEVINDYAINGRKVLDWLPQTLMLASVFAVFTPPPPPVERSWGNGSGNSSSDISCSSGGNSSCSGGSSCGGGGCGGCGGGD